MCSVFAPWADAYIMILKVTAIPYLIVAIVHGVGLLKSSQAKQILKKGLIFIGLAILINISIIYLIKWVFPKPHGASLTGHVLKDVPALNFAELLIPDNVFYDLSNNIVPAVVVFSLLIGISLMSLADKQTIMSSLQTLLESLTRITRWISKITPIGTFIIMANQIGSIEFYTIKQISTYIILYILGTCIVIFWIAPRLTSMLTPMKSYQWLKNLIPVLVLAYTTNLVIVCLPYIINIIQREMQALYPKDENMQSQVQGTVSIVFNLPLGSIFIALFVIFASIFYSSPLTVQGQVQLFLTNFLTSLGAVGLGSWINSLTFILDSLSLPLDAVSLYLASLPFTAGFQSMVSAMLISTLAFLITLACRSLLTYNWKKIILNGVVTIVPVLLIFSGMKIYNPLPTIQNQNKSIYDLEIKSDVNIKVFSKGGPIPEANLIPGEEPLEHVLRTKILRVGYDPQTAPFCFYNKNKQLVGYDIAYATELAYDLGCDLHFIPLTYAKIGEELDSGLYDIGMSAISITEPRLKAMCFPSQFLEGKMVIVTHDMRKKEYTSLNYLKTNMAIKIAVLKGSSFETFVKSEFPDHEIVLIDTYEDFASVPSVANVLIWEEQEAISWSILHPHFQVILPTPVLGKDSLSYPVKAGADHFLCYLNGWMKLKENEGFAQNQYNLWILGKTETVIQNEPRWSIIRNVLHWIK